MKVFPFFMFLAVACLFAGAMLAEHGKPLLIAALVSIGVAGVCALFDFTLEITRTRA